MLFIVKPFYRSDFVENFIQVFINFRIALIPGKAAMVDHPDKMD